MAHINFQTRVLTLKLVYCGPGLSGKTTNLEAVHRRAPGKSAGKLSSIATEGDRTLFFDYMPLDLPRPDGGSVRLQLYTVPGQAYYESTRTLVLQGVDGVAFVADSQPDRLADDVAALDELERNLRGMGKELRGLPHVLQWNKQDLPFAVSPDVLKRELDRHGAPCFSATALKGEGVMATLRELARRAVAHCDAELQGSVVAAGPAGPAAGPTDHRSTDRGARKLEGIGMDRSQTFVRASLARNKTLLMDLEVPSTAVAVAVAPEVEARPPGHATAIVSEPTLARRGRADAPAGPVPPADPAETPVNLPRPSARLRAVASPSSPAIGRAPSPELPFVLPRDASRSAELVPGPGAPHALLVPPEGSGTSDDVDAALQPASHCPWSSADRSGPPDEDAILGQTVGGCVIHTKLGEGGMGAVYVARHALLGKDVVVKVLKPEYAKSERRVERFFLEARATARLEHPNIVQVQDLGTNERGVHYIVMQYVDGQNLDERVRAFGRHAPDEATRLVLEVARALVALHEAGMVHRDIKAENVVVTRKGEVKLIDFGLVKDLNQNLGLTRHGALVGTPVYMAPETGRVEHVDGRADIYSLGLTWYYLLTGRPPFEGQEVHEIIFGRARLRPPAELAPELSDDLLRVLGRMLAWHREDRHPDARALVRDMEALLIGAGVPARPDEPAPPWGRTPPRGTRRTSSSRLKALAAVLPPIPPTNDGELVAPPSPAADGPSSGSMRRPAAEANGPSSGSMRRPSAEANGPSSGSMRRPSAEANGPSSGSMRRAAAEANGPSSGSMRRPTSDPAALPPEAALAALDPARRIGRLVLLGVREAGGLGVLHRAWDPQRQQEVLVRLVDGVRQVEPAAKAALDAAARVRHPGVVALVEHLHGDARLALVLEDHRGRTLEAHARALPHEDAARVARDIARALAHAHAQGVVHGALTPGSVLVDERGHGLLLDLGLPLAEEVVEARRARLAQRLERLGFRPPERVAGAPPEPTGDVWALGAVLAFALTGAAPVIGEDGLTVPPGLPPDLVAICRRALEADLRRRYTGAGDLAADLDRYLGGEAPRARARDSLQARVAARPGLAAGALCVAVLVGALVGSQWRSASAKDEQAALIESLMRRIEEQERRGK